MILTLDDYSELMGMAAWAIAGIPVVGDLSCGPLSCAQRDKIITDLGWAESAIESELGRYGLSLYPKQASILTNQPYVITETGDMLGTLVTVESTIAPDINEPNISLEFTLSSDDYDPDCDTILSHEIKQTPSGRFAVRWLSAVASDYDMTLSAKSINIADVDCDTGETSYPDSVVVVTTILRAGGPRMTRSSSGCGVADDAACGRCGGLAITEGCYRESGENTLLLDFSATPCVCVGRFAYYSVDIVKPNVKRDRFILDAIVALANSRGTLNDCGDCSSAARDRVAREYGVLTTSSKDMRESAPYLFVNPFGVFTPGAVSAWRAVERITAGRGGAGVF